MATVTILKRETGTAHFRPVVEGSDSAALSDIARTSAGAASLWTDAFTTGITVGAAGINLQINADAITGPSDGSGIVIGAAGGGANTGSALQMASYTTAQRDFLGTGIANGMLVYNTTLGQMQGRIAGSWQSLIQIGINNNFAATTDPLVTDDDAASSPGPYEIGSRWINLTDDRSFSCLDSTTGAAIWKQDTNDAQSDQAGKEAPGTHFFGSLMHYPSSGGATAGEIQYIRIWITAGIVFDRLRFFQDSGGNPARSVRLGIYTQATAMDEAGVPVTRVAQTASTATSAANDLTFVDVNLVSPYTVTTTGYYWLAAIADSASLKQAVSAVHRADFLPIRRESGTGTTLPATVGTITNPSSAVAYVAAVEQ